MTRARAVVVVLALAAASPVGGRADGPRTGEMRPGRAVRTGESIPLRDAAKIGRADEGDRPVREHPRMTRGPAAPGSGRAQEDPARGAGRAGPKMPATGVEFDGIEATGFLPPDPVGDVGPDHYVEMVNTSYAVYDKTGSLLAGPADINTLFTGFGGLCESTNEGDPIVLHDQLADQWLLSQFAFDTVGGSPVGPFHQCIAISETADPTGAYHLYDFEISATKLNDYPKFGVWPDAYYMSVNQFDEGTFAYGGVAVVAFERDAMLAGDPADSLYADFETAFAEPDLCSFGLLPADLDGATEPPAGSPGYFLEAEDDELFPECLFGFDQIRVWEVDVDWTGVPSGDVTGPVQIDLEPDLAMDMNMCNLDINCIPTPAGDPPGPTSRYLDALSDRLMHRAAYRNFGTHESVVVNHTVDLGGDQAGVRWYEVRDPGGTPVVYQGGTYAGDDPGTDTLHRWMGSVAMDASGNVGLGYSASNDSTDPQIRYVGRLVDDPLGELPQGEGTIHAGGGSQQSTTGRWGDYSSMNVDPSDDCTFWYVNEYYASDSDASWITRIASFSFPSCGSASTADFDGDGFGDAAIGVPDEAIGSAAGAGAINVIHGGVGGLVSTGNQVWSQDSPGIDGGSEAGDGFGRALATGDFDGDGFTDLAIGVPDEALGGTAGAGAVHAIYGSASGLGVTGSQLWTQSSAGSGGPEVGDAFGSALAAGDFDGDGRDDLAIGVPFEDLGSTSNAGMVNVLEGSAAGLTAGAGWSQNTSGVEGTAEAGDAFGSALAAGDFDADGRSDLAIGVPQENLGTTSDAGAVNVLYGTSTGLSSTDNQGWTQNTGTVTGTGEAGDRFGDALAVADFDGDARDDVAIGVSREDVGSTSDAGMVNVLYGTSTGLSSTGNQGWTQNSAGGATAEANDRFGVPLSAGDFDGNGFADLIVGVPLENIETTVDAGLLHVIYGTASGLSASGSDVWTQTATGLEVPEANDRFGESVAAADADGDGFADLLAGAPGEALGSIASAGLIHLVHGSASDLVLAGTEIWHQDSTAIGGGAEAGDRFGTALGG